MIQIQRRINAQDPDTRMYFSREVLAEAPCGGERGCLESESNPPAILEAVLALPGVIITEVHVYHLVIVRNPMYTWDEIEHPLLQLMSSLNLGEGKLMEEAETNAVHSV